MTAPRTKAELFSQFTRIAKVKWKWVGLSTWNEETVPLPEYLSESNSVERVYISEWLETRKGISILFDHEVEWVCKDVAA